MSRRALFIVLITMFLAQITLSLGATLTADGNGIVARTDPAAVSVALFLAVLIFIYRPKPFIPATQETVRLRLRVGACVTDVWLAATLLGSFSTFLMLLYVWLSTGSFRWSVRIPAPSGLDIAVAVTLVLAVFAGLLAYWGAHWKMGRQTPGQYVFGYRVEPEPGSEPSLVALLLKGSIGLIYWPVSLILAARRPDRRFWWQVSSKVQSVLAARQ